MLDSQIDLNHSEADSPYSEDLVADPMDEALRQLEPLLASHPGVRLEWSLRVGPRSVSARDRCIIWVDGSRAEDFTAVGQVLHTHEVAAAVQERQAEVASRSISQGIGLSRQGDAVSWRIYLHHRDRDTQADRYEAWLGDRVHAGDASDTAQYRFSFLPETPAGQTPAELVHPEFSQCVAALCERPKVVQMSGFWLRERRESIDRVCLTIPWHPPLAEFSESLRTVCSTIGAPTDWLDEYATHGIRHIGFTSYTAARASVAVYFSAAHTGTWPQSLLALQERVRARSRLVQRKLARRFLTITPARDTRSVALDDFYSPPDLSAWETVLGPELHYHHGIHEASMERARGAKIPDEFAMRVAADRAVRALYPLIPEGARVYDLGCGWGSPALMLARERNCRVLGLTISRAQYRHGAARALPVRYGDMEATLPPGHFDCALLLESFTHVQGKEQLLRLLGNFVDRLVMRVNCEDQGPARQAFAGTMHMITSTALRDLLEATGWSVTHWRDRRPEAVPTVWGWRERLSLVAQTEDQHLEAFRTWCRHVTRCGAQWVANNPLIEVAAVRRS